MEHEFVIKGLATSLYWNDLHERFGSVEDASLYRLRAHAELEVVRIVQNFGPNLRSDLAVVAIRNLVEWN